MENTFYMLLVLVLFFYWTLIQCRLKQDTTVKRIVQCGPPPTAPLLLIRRPTDEVTDNCRDKEQHLLPKHEREAIY